jgi:hypothetical protein
MAQLTARGVDQTRLDDRYVSEQERRSPVARWLLACSPAALGSVAGGYVVCAALAAIVVAIAANAKFQLTEVLGIAGAIWLTASHVPLDLGGAELGALPLLLLLPIAWFAARAAGACAQRLDAGTPATGLGIAGVLGGVHGVAGVVCAVSTGSASPVLAFFGCFVVAALSALLGVAERCGLVRAVTELLDEGAQAGIRLGLRAVCAFFAAGAVTIAVATAANLPTGARLFSAAAPDIGGSVGMLLLCIGYLPNAAIAATSFVSGPGFSFGKLAITPMDFNGGPVPAVPLLSALPDGFATWWPFLLVLPIAVAALTGWAARNSGEHPARRLRVVAVAALVAAASWLVLAALAGGTLGRGAYTPMLVPAGAVAVAVFCWIAAVGGAVAWFAGKTPTRKETEPEFDDDLEDIDIEDSESEPDEPDPAESESAELEAAEVISGPESRD